MFHYPLSIIQLFNYSVIRLFSYFVIQLFVISAQAQWFPSTLLTTPALSEADSNRLTLGTDITGFFKNNEYFSPVAVGQTLPGVSMLMTVDYQVAGKFRTEAGMYVLKYSGEDQLSNIQPFIRMQYAITPNFNMIVGNLYGGINHKLIEPLYQWERHFTDKPESGLQFVLHNERWFTDIWINWQHFIRRGSLVPEMLTFGSSTSYLVLHPSRRFGLSIPLQLLIHHTGGQIDISPDPMIVLGNAATGICSKWKINNFWLRSVGLDVYLAGYYDRYPNTDLRPYTYSLGVYPVLHIDAMPLEIMAGYWQTEKYHSFTGEPLFGSFDPYHPTNREKRLPERKMITLKLAYNLRLLKGVLLGTQVEIYTDLFRNATDYSFGVHLRFNDRFILK